MRLRFYTALAALLFGFAQSLEAQCTSQQVRACSQSCGPIADVGQQRYSACMNKCEAACNPPRPNCHVTGTVAGAVFPKYYILGLVYAPPGCTSSATQKCAAQSSVDYQAGSTMGTKVSTDSSFASNVDVTVNASFGVGDALKFDASATAGYGDTSDDSKSQTISKGKTLDIKASGNGDGVDHSQDAFILLLNPAVAVSEAKTFSDQCRRSVNWYMGLSGSRTEELYTVYVQWLKNPSTMPPSVAQQLRTLGFTNADYQTILAQDPFASGSTAIDPNRFTPTMYTFQYEPPLQEKDCPNGVCSCIAMSDSIKNQLQTDHSTKSQTQYSVGFTEKASGLDIGIFSFGASSDQKFNWTSSSTNDNTTDSSQTVAATVVCPSVNYQGPTLMSIYWDNLFGSFLFVPTQLTPPAGLLNTASAGGAPGRPFPVQLNSSQFSLLNAGNVSTVAGRPVAHQAITLTVAGKTYHTWTNSRGDYVFFRPNLPATILAATGFVAVRGITQTVSIGSPQKVQLRVPN